MKKQWLLALLSTLLLLMTDTAFSDDSTKTPGKDFHGSAQAGMTRSTGNSEETTANGKLSATYNEGKWTNQGAISAFTDINREKDNAEERYEINAQRQYNFSKKNFAYVSSDYLADSEDGYDYLLNTSIGYGRTLFHDDGLGMNIDWQVGPGYRFQPNDDSTINDHVVTTNTGIIFKWQINDINSLEQTVNVSFAEDDTITTSNTAYTAHLYKSLALQLSVNLRYDSNVPNDKEATDTISTMNLLYSF